MEDLNRPERALPENTILFCKKSWQVPSMILALLVALTFVWASFILANYEDMDFYENSYELSVPEFLFRDMAGNGMEGAVQAVATGVVGIGTTTVNMPPVASGALVSPNGHVITALHPLKNLKEIAVLVRTSSGTKRYLAEITKALPGHNVALLKVLTPDRFMYFTMADTTKLMANSLVTGIGFNAAGNTIFKEGQLQQVNATMSVGAQQLSHLLSTDAVYTWEQTGGPVINRAGELVGIGMSVIGDNQLVQGFVVPAHVLAADFGDVLTFKVNPGNAALDQNNGPSGSPAMVSAGFGNGNMMGNTPPNMSASQGAGIDPGQGSAPWWQKARAQVQQNQPMGMNIAAPNGPMAQAGPNGVAGQGSVQGQNPQLQAQQGGVNMTAGGIFDPDHINRTRVAGFTVGDIVSLMLLAVVVGVTSGMVTMGGGVLQVAGMMVIFGYGMHLIRPVAYLTNLFIFGAAVRRNARSGLIMWDTVKSITPWACVGVVAGYFIGNSLGDQSMGLLLGIFAALMTAKGLQELLSKDENQEEVVLRTDEVVGDALVEATDEELEDLIEGDGEAHAQSSHEVVKEQTTNAGLGMPIGLISGMLGISGGVVAVPMQRMFANAPLHNAIANSSVVVFWASLTGALIAFLHGVPTGLIDLQAPLAIAAIMIPGAYVGGLIGAKLMKTLPVQLLRGVYTTIMAVVAVKMLFLN
ncbi:magnetosome protein MamO [Magnetovibrio sp. PR-2]|uniref:magnetosome protein MamO n=1 Tax=Magnetovibrio sp. PR-2 TaxID=3120356 RepID=UPI002FCE5C4A